MYQRTQLQIQSSHRNASVTRKLPPLPALSKQHRQDSTSTIVELLRSKGTHVNGYRVMPRKQPTRSTLRGLHPWNLVIRTFTLLRRTARLIFLARGEYSILRIIRWTPELHGTRYRVQIPTVTVNV